MRIIVDTNVFFSRVVIDALWDDARPKIVPAVVFLERARQLLRDRGIEPDTSALRRGLSASPPAGNDADAFESRLNDAGWRIEPFGAEEAARLAARVKNDATWKRHFRDAMIAGHVRERDELWTHNARDFSAVGLDKRRIVDLSSRDPPKLSADDILG